MSVIEWDRIPDRILEYGLDRGVLYVAGSPAVPWNGLLRVDENTEGGQLTPVYMSGKIVTYRRANESYRGAIAAITYPDEFEQCDGFDSDGSGLVLSHQKRKGFSLSYRTRVMSPLDEMLGTKLHLIFNAVVAPAQRQHGTISQTVNPLAMSWDISAVPVKFTNRRPTAHVIFDSRVMDPATFEELEQILYGTPTTEARFPTVAEIQALMKKYGYQFSIGSGSLVLQKASPAWLYGDPDVGIYRQTLESPLVPIAGNDGLYSYQDV